MKIEKGNYREHRIIWLLITGEWPTDQIDHENQDRGDNRWANLRDATQTVNQRNRTLQKNNTSGVPGVAWHERDQRWRARIKVDGAYVNLGAFHSKDEAILARWEGELKYDFHGNHGRSAA
ncbi:HNH endonuclease [Mesorhizobium sp. M0139]|uniref:HNH endonuclease n=1 Tax=Mesorhizobium sp. M0139 TaxID=2956892 RepID=UPI0033373E50